MAKPESIVMHYGNNSKSNIVHGDQTNYLAQTPGSDLLFREMMEKFAQPNYNKFRNVVSSPHPQTCQWYEGESTIRNWMGKVGPPSLWLVGAPGLGKTVWARHLLETLERDQKSGTRTIYFFCDREREERHKTALILRSLIHQFLAAVHCDTETPHRQHQQHVEKVVNQYRLSGPVLLSEPFRLGKLFVEIMSNPGPGEWYCIIDSIDDCEETERKDLLEYITCTPPTTNETSNPRIRLLITSRPFEGFESTIEKLKNGKVVYFTNAHGKQLNEVDIETYIRDHARHPKFFKHYGTAQKRSLEEHLVREAAGNFKWAVSMIHSLDNELSGRYVELLATLPSGMEMMVQQIKKRASNRSMLLLRLVACAERELSATELAALIRLHPSVSEGPFAELFKFGTTAQGIRETIPCSEEALRLHDDKVQFFHPSVKNHFRDKLLTEEQILDTHLKLAQTCLLYLRGLGRENCSLLGHGAREKSTCRSEYTALVERLPFLEYASVYWSYHVRQTRDHRFSKLLHLLYETIIRDDDARNLSFQIYRFWKHEEYITDQSSLHILVHHNLTHVTQQLLQPDSYPKFKLDLRLINAGDSKNRTPLWWAVKHGQLDMVELLLQIKGVKCNMQDDDDLLSPVTLAVKYGCVEMIKLILDATPGYVDWNLLDCKGFTCLYRAAISGYEDLMPILLGQQGVYPHIETQCDGMTPLVSAARKGRGKVVKVLLEHKANPNTTDSVDERTALSWAAGNGDEDVVYCLLQDSRTDILHRDKKEKRTAFQWAAARKKKRIAKMILAEALKRHGNDHARDLLGDAARMGQEEALEVLLEVPDLDPDSKIEPKRQSALLLAAKYGHVQIARKLLSLGNARVDVNSKDVRGKTPLIVASERGHADVVEELLKHKKINLNEADVDGKTARDWAKSEARWGILRLIDEARGVGSSSSARY